MATTATRTTLITEVLVQANPADPFRYGWREVRRVWEDGSETWERVPLTLLDVLHPQEGDYVTHAEAHERWCLYLYDVFSARLAGDPAAVVLHDVLVAWDVPDLRPHGPDLAVIRGVQRRQNRSTFDVVAEGVRPALIVEVTSPATVGNDRVTKFDQYELCRVPLYVIVDAVGLDDGEAPRLFGYELAGRRYRPMTPDAQGRLWLEPVRAWLGAEGSEIACYDEAGRAIGGYVAQVAARADAEARAEAEAAARRVAEDQVAALEEELRRLRGG